MPIVPLDVRKAVALFRNNPARAFALTELAAACGVAPRTLQKHFRAFLGRTPTQAQREIQLDAVRRELITGKADATVADIALRSGFRHLGRFSRAYRERFGEAPSETLRQRQRALSMVHLAQSPPAAAAHQRPSIRVEAVAVGTADCQGLAQCVVEEVALALLRLRWVCVTQSERARYTLRVSIKAGPTGMMRLLLMLIDGASGRYVWADRRTAATAHELDLDELAIGGMARGIETAIRKAEVCRAVQMPEAERGPWELTMNALPLAFRLDAAALAQALELVEQAMELDPHDALPAALAAWCRAQRGTHHFTGNSTAEKQAAHVLAQRASALNAGDARVDALLGGAETLAHNLSLAKSHCDRAVAVDGGNAWGWMRSGFVHAYAGRSADAVECFHLAWSLDPKDPLAFSRCTGLGIACFEVGRFAEAADWWTRLMHEHPSATWANRFRAPALLFAGKKDEAERSFQDLRRMYPSLTILDVQGSLPHTQAYMDNACNGLETLGLQTG